VTVYIIPNPTYVGGETSPVFATPVDASSLGVSDAVGPTTTGYAPGSFTVASGKSIILCGRLQLMGAQRVVASGTARIRIT
jgi:hypothetical protein